MNDRFYSCAKALVATVRAGSISAAATALKTTKSAISQKLSLFEAELGLVLLDRSGRSVVPTAAGRRIFDVCVGPIDSASEAEAQLGLMHTDTVSGRVAISGPNALLCMIFVPMISGLRARYPKIELEIFADDARTDFAADDIDLSFRTGDPERGRYVATPLRMTNRTLCASPEFLEQNRPIERPRDLEKSPCVLRQHECPHWVLEDRQGRQCTVKPNVVLRANTMEMTHAAARLGNGVALLPALSVQSDLDSGALVSLLPRWSIEQVKLTLLCRATSLSRLAVAAVRRHVLDTCGDVS